MIFRFKCFFLLFFSVSLYASPSYYGKYLEEFPLYSAGQIKRALHLIISSPHLPSKGEADIILIEQDHCPVEVPSCYRHKLLSTRKVYKTAKDMLYQYITPIQMKDGSYRLPILYTKSPLFAPKSTKNFISLVKRNKNNTEHIWPRSRFGSSKKSGRYQYQLSDLHHLYPSKAIINSVRSSFLFGESLPVLPRGSSIKPETLKKWNSQIGENLLGKVDERLAISNQLFFSPIPTSRGKVARAMFYFSIRYKLPISKIDEFFLRKWHREHPVTKEEVLRNERVFKVQGNRNPFVDYPELVGRIDDF